MLSNKNMGSIVLYKGEKAVLANVNNTRASILMYEELEKSNTEYYNVVSVDELEVIAENVMLDFYIDKLEKMELEIERLESEHACEGYISEKADAYGKLFLNILKNAVKRLA